jgi:hypothetical protein
MVTTTEQTIFNHILPDGVDFGVMNHFWATAPGPVLDGTIVRYYVDDEMSASIEYFPPLACGVGFNDQTAPWGTAWFGKGAKDGAWYNNFKIPFQKSIRVTIQHVSGNFGGFYMIVRGTPSTQINIGGIQLPKNAKLKLIKTNKIFKPVDWVPLVDIPQGSGLFFMHSLSVNSGNLNFLEGCYHQYTPYNAPFPGTVLSTGTEDYFDSAWYFDAGQFWLPNSGFTHLKFESTNNVTWSAYRFHFMDALPFQNGFKFMWRNGDLVDITGQKCYIEGTKGIVVGNPTNSLVVAYAWVYVW